MESVITEVNAGHIETKLIVEAANGPVTPQADEVLMKRGIELIPDVFANAGGVIVSYFEWSQNIQGYRWTESEVNERLLYIMKETYAALRSDHGAQNLRHAAYRLALRRVAEATLLRS
jgi:glutamate dehydrogenase/leucine dehydrogenase